MLPLDDIRVVDLTIARAGPVCVRQLADWGAEVIRVEAPPSDRELSTVSDWRSSDSQNLHRNKRSLTLDLKTEDGREVLHALVATADVLVENMRPSVKRRLGFDYETVSACNPRIVMGSISGFGETGPYADRAGVDQIAQGMGGLMSVTGFPGSAPTRVGIAVSDLAAGLYLAFAILAALHERARTDAGQWVQTSLLEAMIGMMDFQVTRCTVDGDVPAQEGNHHPTMVPMGCFATSDGYVNVAGAFGRLWPTLCNVIGMPELVGDSRFASGARRSARRDELNDLIGARLRARTTAEWVEDFNAAGLPCGPVYRVDEMLADPQVKHLGVIETVASPTAGSLPLVRNPVRSTRPVASVRTPPPAPGAHSDEILRSLGYSAPAIADLRRRNVI